MANRRRFVGLLAGAALAAGCAGPGPLAPQAAPPIVLVHGAWMGAASWDKVVAELRRQGREVSAVELPGHGADPTPPERLSLETYVQAVLAALPRDRRAVLVGHSMGGIVISAVAERAPERLARLVYVAAYLPRDGDSLYKLAMTDKDSRVGAFWTQADPKANSPATIRSEGLAEVFCADCSAGDRQWLERSHRAEAVPPLATPVALSSARFGSVPRSYVHTTRDRAVSFALQRSMLQAAGGAATLASLDTSHLPMLTRPAELAAIIAGAR